MNRLKFYALAAAGLAVTCLALVPIALADELTRGRVRRVVVAREVVNVVLGRIADRHMAAARRITRTR